MENPTPFDLNEAIRRWQEKLGASPAIGADNLEELASHLRASVQRLKAGGLSEEEAFQIATRRIGERCALEQEYAKVKTAAAGSLPMVSFWIVAGIYVLQVGYSLSLVILDLAQGCLQRLMAGGGGFAHPLRHLIFLGNADRAPYYPTTYVAYVAHPWMVMELLLVILVARLAESKWKGFGGFVRSFERPIRTSLDLVVLGLAGLLLPEVNRGFGGFSVMGNEGYLTGTLAVNVALVLTMVLLARRGLRKNGRAAA